MRTTTFPGFPAAAEPVDTRAMAAGDVRLRMPVEPCDTFEQMARADHADWVLLRLVLCVATATLLLAAASSLSL